MISQHLERQEVAGLLDESRFSRPGEFRADEIERLGIAGRDEQGLRLYVRAIVAAEEFRALRAEVCRIWDAVLG